jgi:hypothetical protein
MAACPDCKSKTCKKAVKLAALNKAIEALAVAPRERTQPRALTVKGHNAKEEAAEAAADCEYTTFRNTYGRCPLCRRPLCSNRHVLPTDLECGMVETLVWRGWGEHREACLELAWQRNVAEERSRGAEVC